MTPVVFIGSNQAQRECQNHPHQSNPLCGLSQQLIQAAVTALAHVGTAVACNGAGQTGFLTGLDQNNDYQRNAGDDLQDGQNDLQNFHLFNLPPTVLETAHSG